MGMQFLSLDTAKAIGNPAGNSGADGVDKQSIAQEARRDLLEKITEFMLGNGLEVTDANLRFANAALSGHNPQMAEKLVAREISGKSITQEWIDSTIRLDENLAKQVSETEQLMERFENLMGRFVATTDKARADTESYADAFGRQCSDLEQAAQGDDFSPLIRISHAMLESIQRIEESMRESEAETAELRESLTMARREADLDHLTGLPNRRAFERRFNNAVESTVKSGKPVCVAFCDVDHFKRVNDTHGHGAGDRVLRAIAQTLQEIASEDCFVARHGGEEFAIIFDGLGKDDAWVKLEGARRVLASRRIRNRASEVDFGRITFSAGIAEISQQGDPRDALTHADATLYRAKDEGRNRVLVH